MRYVSTGGKNVNSPQKTAVHETEKLDEMPFKESG
jgi:hypothetical protein